MGWGNCGIDKKGRPIGYSFDGTCDYPGCKKTVNRGLGCACGGMHGEFDLFCDKYCCGEHMYSLYLGDIVDKDQEPEFYKESNYISDFDGTQICKECLDSLEVAMEAESEEFYHEHPELKPPPELRIKKLIKKFIYIEWRKKWI